MTAGLPVTFGQLFPFVVTPTLFVAQFVRFSSADVAEIEKAEVVKLRYIFTFLRNLFVSEQVTLRSGIPSSFESTINAL